MSSSYSFTFIIFASVRVTQTSKAMQTTAIGTVASSLPENEVILLTLLISKRYIPYTDLRKISGKASPGAMESQAGRSLRRFSSRIIPGGATLRGLRCGFAECFAYLCACQIKITNGTTYRYQPLRLRPARGAHRQVPA